LQAVKLNKFRYLVEQPFRLFIAPNQLSGLLVVSFILDERMFRTSTPSAVALLASRLLVPTATGDFREADLAVIKDKWAEYQAMAVLFPEEARDEFFALFTDGKVSVEEISRRLVLPIDKVAFVMTTHWPKVLDALKGID
jgi:hypothetical protein